MDFMNIMSHKFLCAIVIIYMCQKSIFRKHTFVLAHKLYNFK